MSDPNQQQEAPREALAEALVPFTRSVLHDDVDAWRRSTATAILAALAARGYVLSRASEPLQEVVERVPATAKALQYVNPNVREDAYNKGVRDLADAIATAVAALSDPLEPGP